MKDEFRWQRGCARLSAASWCEAQSAVHDGVSALPPPQRPAFRARLVALLHRTLALCVLPLLLFLLFYVSICCSLICTLHVTARFWLLLKIVQLDDSVNINHAYLLRSVFSFEVAAPFGLLDSATKIITID
jgi:hypothetical protein